MSNINSPRGFKPAGEAIGAPYQGRLTTYRIPSGYATSVYLGDVVKLVAGYVQKANPGDQFRGVVAGFEWINTSGLPMFSPFFPGGTITQSGQDVQVQVIDDPNAVFVAQFTNSAVVPTLTLVGGKQFNLIDLGGNVSTGLSGEGVDYTTLTTAAAQFRFLDFVRSPGNDLTSAYMLARFMPSLHDLRVNTGE